MDHVYARRLAASKPRSRCGPRERAIRVYRASVSELGDNEHQLVWTHSEDGEEAACDLRGHFWAEAKRLFGAAWSFTIFDYQNNKMLDGIAESLDGAKAAVDGWNRWVVHADRDPSRGWPDDE